MKDERMYPVRIDDVVSRPHLTVDLYLQLGREKYILVAKAGAQTDVLDLKKYQNKGVAYLFIKPADFIALAAETLSVAGVAVEKKSLSTAAKLAVIEESINIVHREIETIGINETVLGHARLVTQSTMSVISVHPNLSDLVEKLADLKNPESRHAMTVSMVATMLGQGHEWIKTATLEKLALGGLLHDVGKSKLPSDIAKKPYDRMTYDEKVIYKSHPELGRQLLASVKTVPDDVLLMIYEHHECSDGSGFPRGIRDFQISPLARVVALANGFAELALGSSGRLTAKSARLALEEITQQRASLYNKDAVRALKRLLDGDGIRKTG